MSNPTYSAKAFKPAGGSAATRLLKELFAATPLHIFVTALKQALRDRRAR